MKLIVESNPDLESLLARARAHYETMTPAQRKAMIEAQRQSFCRAEAGFGSDADEAEYAAAVASADPDRIAVCEAKSKARMAAFDAMWDNA